LALTEVAETTGAPSVAVMARGRGSGGDRVRVKVSVGGSP